MAPKLYGSVLSPCVRAPLLTAKALNIELIYVDVDILNKEHLSPEYVKMNPQHTVPCLDDDGYIVWDSHAIMIYLAEKYGKGNYLYPADLQKRATINRLLFFECGDIFAMHRYICYEILYDGVKQISEGPVRQEEKALEFLETFLKNTKYVAGDEMTIADFSFWTTLSNSSYFVPIDKHKYPRITEWMELMNQLPYKEINNLGAELYKEKLNSLLEK